MTASRVAIAICFIALLGVPLLFRPERAETAASDPAARRLIIITPHNEQIRREFARTFDQWHRDRYGERVNVIYSVPGGTTEIRKMLQAQFVAALEAGRAPGGDADLVFGGGSYEHSLLKRGVSVTVAGETRSSPISEPVDFDDAWLNRIYGPNIIGDVRLYDPDKHWFGTALSGFGIVFNRDTLAQIGVVEPVYWEDLCDPRLRGWVSLVNPGQSGSITTAFDTILQRRGWDAGWKVLRRAGANARYFSASALKGPIDVSQGNAAMGVCIDFYGRYQSHAIARASGVPPERSRVGYVDPPGAGTIDPDPISLLRGAPHAQLARRFIEFCLTEEAQSLWQFAIDDPADDGLGPREFELRRLPVLRSMYERHFDRMIDRVNPYELAAPLDDPNPNYRDFVAVLFASMAMDAHHQLIRAWRAITSHPAYPGHGGIVTADSPEVRDPTLRRMLELFDAMPELDGPEGRTFSLGQSADLAAVRAGWLHGGWADHTLWHPESTPADAMRQRFTRFFRENYQEIVRLAEE